MQFIFPSDIRMCFYAIFLLSSCVFCSVIFLFISQLRDFRLYLFSVPSFLLYFLFFFHRFHLIFFFHINLFFYHFILLFFNFFVIFILGLYDIHIHSRHLYFLEEDEGVSNHVELHDLTVSEIMTKRPICLR